MKYSFNNVSVIIEPSRLSVIQKHRKSIPYDEEVLIFRTNGRAKITHLATGQMISYPDSCNLHVQTKYLSWSAAPGGDIWHGCSIDIIIPFSKMNKREKTFLLTLRITNTLQPI